MTVLDLSAFAGFQWDEGNRTKNWTKHAVTEEECEQVFFHRPLLLFGDISHSRTEPRYYVLGRTDARRLLFVAFTPRGKLIRIICARDMTNRESRRYRESKP